jgi:hypothetical protein
MPPVFRFQRRQGYLQPGGEPQNNQALRSHSKDPSSVRVAPFAPDLHPDQAQFAILRRQQAEGIYRPLHLAQKRHTHYNAPPQLRTYFSSVQFPLVGTFPVGGTILPQLLAAANPNRLNFTIFNSRLANVCFSYDAPATFPVNNPMAISTNGVFRPGEGSCSINEIWCSILPPYPLSGIILVGIYEYVLDLTGNWK